MRAGLFVLLVLCGCGGSPEAAKDALEGSWRVTTIDGDPVGAAEFQVRVRDGRVIGGKDGCSAWVFDMTRPPTPQGMRLVITDLTPCPAIPQRPAYWRALGNGNARPVIAGAGRLRLEAGGSELVAEPLGPAPLTLR